VLIVSGLATIALTIALVVKIDSGRQYTFPMLFAPVGTFIRWRFSKINTKVKSFPIGTFIVNVAGSSILGILYIISQRTSILSIDCAVIAGLMNGFCGCLTTVSTFILEVTILKKKQGYTYGIGSIAAAQICVAIEFIVYVSTGGSTTSGGSAALGCQL